MTARTDRDAHDPRPAPLPAPAHAAPGRYYAAAMQTSLPALKDREEIPSRVDELVRMAEGTLAGYEPFHDVRLFVFPEFAHCAPLYPTLRELLARTAVRPEDFAAPYERFCRANGVFVQTGSFIEHDPRYLGVAFNASLLVGPGGVLTGMAKRTLEAARTISVSTPDELDKLIEWVGASAPVAPIALEGEHLFAVERLVVSPAAGVFTPETGLSPGTQITVGTVIGRVGNAEVRSPFAGRIENFIAVDGERVTTHQPIAWLRTN